MKRSLHLTSILLAALLVACDAADLTSPDAQALENAAAMSAGPASIPPGQQDNGPLFDELAAKIPGFGGLYRTGQCSFVVVLTDMSQEAHAIHVVHAALAPLVSHPCPPGGVQVSAVQGQFTYRQLKGYLAASRPLLDIPGVLGASIDYQQNRLVIVIRSRLVAQAVIEALPRAGIPAAAVLFELG